MHILLNLQSRVFILYQRPSHRAVCGVTAMNRHVLGSLCTVMRRKVMQLQPGKTFKIIDFKGRSCNGLLAQLKRAKEPQVALELVSSS